MSAFIDLGIRHPRAILVAVLVVAVTVGSGAFFLKIDFSPEQVYAGQSEEIEFCEQHRKLFRFEDSLLLVLLESTDSTSLIRADVLTWCRDFAERLQPLEGVENVTSLTTLQVPRRAWRGNDEMTWVPLLPEDSWTDSAELTRRLKKIPLLNDTLISSDHQLIMTLVDLDPADRSIVALTERVIAVEKVLGDSPLPVNTRTFLSGVPAIRVDVIRSIVADQFRMTPLCSLLFLIASLLMFRNPLATALSLFAVLTSVALTVGIMGWTGQTFTLLSNVIPALVLIIGAANTVHIVSRFQAAMSDRKRISQLDTAEEIELCVRETMREMSRTCFLTLGTTAIGFGSLLIAHADLLKLLAVQAASGMMCCYVSLMAVLPAALILCGAQLAKRSRTSSEATVSSPDGSTTPRREGAESNTNDSRLARIWPATAALVNRHAALLVIVHLLAAGATLWACRNIPINSYMLETYDGDHPTMDAVRVMDDRMSGLVSLEVQLQATDRSRFFDGDVAAALADIREQIRADDRVTFYRDYVEFLSVFDHSRTLSADSAAAADSLRRVRLVLKKLDDTSMTSTFIGSEEPVARVMMRIRDVGSLGMKDLFNKVDGILRETLPDDIDFRLTGDAWLHAICMDVFVRDMFYSLVAASGIIFLLITFLFRSFRIGLISAVPNMLPLVMTLGYMHVRGYELTAGNVIVFTISLGIAVDDTIHFLARYRDECRTNSTDDAIRRTLFSSGRAIVLTSLFVVSGLSILIFSDFVPTRRFAELTAVTMCSALPGDIILLPALLRCFGRSHGVKRNGRDDPSETPDERAAHGSA